MILINETQLYGIKYSYQKQLIFLKKEYIFEPYMGF